MTVSTLIISQLGFLLYETTRWLNVEVEDNMRSTTKISCQMFVLCALSSSKKQWQKIIGNLMDRPMACN